MVGKESNMKTFNMLHFVADNAGLSTFEAIEKAYNMGVSEQQLHVLNKLRAELIQSIQNGTLKIESGNEELFRIIDKYIERSDEE